MDIKRLVITTLILLLIAVFLLIYDGMTGVRSLKESLSDIDTTQVTGIEVFPRAGGNKIVIKREKGGAWKLALNDGRKTPVEGDAVISMLSAISKLKPSALISKSPENFKEYLVDDKGARVKLYDGSEMLLDLVIGKFASVDGKDYVSYVRLKASEEIYEVQGMLDMVFASKEDELLIKEVTGVITDGLKEISVTAVDNKPFVISRNQSWMIDGEKADSSKILRFISDLSLLRLRILPEIKPDGIQILNRTEIRRTNGKDIILTGGIKNGRSVITVSGYEEFVFDGTREGADTLIFKDRGNF